MSPELARPLRTEAQARRDTLTNLGDLYFLLQEGRYGLEPMERDFPITKKQLVADLAGGEHNGCVVILKGEIGGLLTDVTEDIMEDVATYRREVMQVEQEPPEKEYFPEYAA